MTFRPLVALATMLASVTVAPPVARGANCLAYLAADVAFERDSIPFKQAVEKAKKRLQEAANARYASAVDAAKARFSKAEKKAGGARKEAYAAAERPFANARKAAYAIYDKSLPPGICRSVTPGGGRKRCNPTGKERRIERAAKRKYGKAVSPASSVRRKARSAANQVYRRALAAARERRNRETGQAGEARRSATKASAIRIPAALGAKIPKIRRARDDAYIAAYAEPGPYRRNTRRYDREIVLKAARHERMRHCPR